MDTYAIVGASGFGREVMPVARETLKRERVSDNYELVFIDDPSIHGTRVNGHRCIDDHEFLSAPYRRFFNIAIADSKLRKKIADRYLEAGAQPFTIRANNALIMDESAVGQGAILCAFTTITSNVRIGQFFHANIYSYVAHDCVVGDYVTFAPSVKCNGAVIVEDFVYVGTGAIVRQGTNQRPMILGQGSTVGMGAVVTKSIEPGIVVVGNPAGRLSSND